MNPAGAAVGRSIKNVTIQIKNLTKFAIMTSMKIIYGKYIATDPKILVGKPIIIGTRIPVDIILKKLAADVTKEELLTDFPRLKKEHIREVLLYAHSVIEKEEIFPLNK